MRRFKNILVGVDLSAGGWFVTEELTPPTQEAIDRAIWLAKMNQARLMFFYALDSRGAQMSADRQVLLQEDHGQRTVEDHANEVLAGLLKSAADQGVEAGSRVVLGKSWVEAIRQVLRGQHDLVIVGTRHLGRLSGMLLGSTGIKLLRKCPCPVWVTQSKDDGTMRRILVATDFTPVCDLAVDLGASMARLNSSELHIVHAVDCRLENYLKRPVGGDRELVDMIREGMLADARRQLDRQLTRAAVTEMGTEPIVHLADGDPAANIKEHVGRLDIDLLVMGTLARSGISGMIVGSTAEQLLPQVSCSILALKPETYESPITLD